MRGAYSARLRTWVLVTEPTLSIIVATSGRRSLRRTLASIAPQLEPGDEIIVACDASGDAGDTPRNAAMPRARGTHLAFLDDDDVYAKDAFEKFRRFAREHPGRIGIFKIKHVVGTTHWRKDEPVLRYANVSTQTYLVPNVPGQLGSWHYRPRPNRPGEVHAGDYVFITETVELNGREPIFVDEVTVYVRPVGRLRTAWARARYRAALGTRLRLARARLTREGGAARAATRD
jgi:glycosyltransferase involved in cell wall biosynthesis